MPKKKETVQAVKVVEEKVEKSEEGSVQQKKEKIAVLTVEFGREDLNALRDKLNEVITQL